MSADRRKLGAVCLSPASGNIPVGMRREVTAAAAAATAEAAGGSGACCTSRTAAATIHGAVLLGFLTMRLDAVDALRDRFLHF